MKHKTPVSELAESLRIDTSAMNQSDRQDAVCKAAQERIQELESKLKKEQELSQSLLNTIGDIRTATGNESLMSNEIAGRISDLLGKPE